MEIPAMKTFPALAVLLLAAAGCAAQPEQLAQADCKVAPITTASVGGRAKPVSSLEQRDAEMQLASSQYRMHQLRERGLVNNNVEEALRDCGRATR
jgi:uncharacterized lipoprotein YajG